MNCNSFGNYFRLVCEESEIAEKEDSYYHDKTYYPKTHCYIAKLPYKATKFKYSEAIDYLVPKDYNRWLKTRFV